MEPYQDAAGRRDQWTTIVSTQGRGEVYHRIILREAQPEATIVGPVYHDLVHGGRIKPSQLLDFDKEMIHHFERRGLGNPRASPSPARRYPSGVAATSMKRTASVSFVRGALADRWKTNK